MNESGVRRVNHFDTSGDMTSLPLQASPLAPTSMLPRGGRASVVTQLSVTIGHVLSMRPTTRRTSTLRCRTGPIIRTHQRAARCCSGLSCIAVRSILRQIGEGNLEDSACLTPQTLHRRM